MLELLSLTWNNIGRFTTEQTIDFIKRDKLIQIDGKNLNTGGSSGAAKTTIINAIDYNLGVNDIPTTILQSRLTKKPMYVSARYNTPIGIVTVTRDKKEGLSIVTPTETVSGNSKLAEEKLDELIRIPRSIFKRMIHKRQKERGFFLNMTAKETFQFLIKMLDQDKYLIKIDKIAEDVKIMSDKIMFYSSSLEGITKSIDEFTVLRQNKQQPIQSVTVDDINQAKGQYDTLNGKLNTIRTQKEQEVNYLIHPTKGNVSINCELLNKLKSELSFLSKERDNIVKEKSQQKDLLKDNIMSIRNFLDNIVRAKKEITRIGSETSNLREQLEHIKAANCPTCKQKWSNESSIKKAEEITQSINKNIQEVLKYRPIIEKEEELKANLLDFNNKLSLPEDNTKIEEIDLKISNLQVQITSEQAKHLNINKEVENVYLQQKNEYMKQRNSIEEKYQKDIVSINEEIYQAKIKLSDLTSSYNNYQKNIKDYYKEISNLDQILNEKKQSLNNTEIELHNLKKKTLIAQETQRLIKSFTLQIFQETLDAIGEKATKILNGIPNMANATIYFESCKENKNGTLKDEVHAIINMDGENDIPTKSLCGGEETSVDLSVDLAVIDIIEQKTNQGANFFVLDEPFDGEDAICRENCLEMLKQIDTNKKIIIIDHSSELKEMVSDVINVIRSGEISTVE